MRSVILRLNSSPRRLICKPFVIVFVRFSTMTTMASSSRQNQQARFAQPRLQGRFAMKGKICDVGQDVVADSEARVCGTRSRGRLDSFSNAQRTCPWQQGTLIREEGCA